jgi:hypothetical protein
MPRGKWTIDFGVMSVEEAAQYEDPFEHLKKHVYPIRSKNRRSSYAAKWWQYAEARPGMRAALSGKPRFIATPEVSKHRLFVWVTPEVLCNQQLLIFARADDYFFGILHSRVHEVWSLAQGTQLREKESGFRYTPTTCFETFPFPNPTPTQEQAVAEAARRLDQERRNWLGDRSDRTRTLTSLYNKQPSWLVDAHRALNTAVFAAYGWESAMGEEEILEQLLALNLSRSATN